ncbi:MAG: response regulator transcription factor [Bacteroidetes bacterium]|nr:response regulator transcription factor [Bacteroidota bacterium]
MLKCVIIDDDPTARLLLKQYISKDSELDLLNEFNNPTEALNYVNNTDFDLLFLDIEMPEMTGIEFIELLNKKLPQTIFTTSYKDFAINAFKYNVTGYLIKPVEYPAFCNAILKVKDNIKESKTQKSNKDSVLFIKNGDTIAKLNIKDLGLIECIGDYVNLYTSDQKFTIHSTMKAMEKKFSSEEFIRVHRSYIIRIDKIEVIEDDSIRYGKKNIPIGKTYKTQVYSRLNIM